MNRIIRIGIRTCFMLALSFLAIGPAVADEILIDSFDGSRSKNWQEKSFAGTTRYFPDRVDGRPCLKAQSSAAASGLFYKISVAPSEYPFLSWSWRVENILAKGDARQKSGDDYPARIYVVFPSFFFWKTRAINYIWANRLPKESAIENPYTSQDIMIAVESGAENTGRWLTETRNVYQDYKKHFGEEPDRIGYIALMTDTDNTGESAVACYGPIRLLSGTSDPQQ